MYETVMLVDDSEIDNYIHKIILEKYSFAKKIIVRTNGLEALNALHNVKSPEDCPDLIFLDIRMPEMDGFAFLEAFRHLPEDIRTKAKILMLSSSLDPVDMRRANDDPHVARYLVKPLEIDRLEDLARR